MYRDSNLAHKTLSWYVRAVYTGKLSLGSGEEGDYKLAWDQSITDCIIDGVRYIDISGTLGLSISSIRPSVNECNVGIVNCTGSRITLSGNDSNAIITVYVSVHHSE